ncbi:TATA box-binding protein-associated factor RNA polymerase I subunit B-like [Magnolia sinica]|uniref:TATA box-binding protein-associated factor RNA polymerase I subunit B-like n=1 Tax=Magnolia sinica TaxID=86752 RepID=UPI002657E855|nr:TATA box-binding protein-associated factor RNA polymerase I subunit B-like [Magnolia sinica]XP_058078743.1 TATA box-binding protein-associated factor RNA polymerase I subunit B-like [Magnolia sinica]
MDTDDKILYCDNCGHLATFNNGDDGFYYCQTCGSQAQDVIDTAGQGEDLFNSGIYNLAHSRKIKSEPISQSQNPTPFPKSLKPPKEEDKPYLFEEEISMPLDFGNSMDPIDANMLVNNIRLRYVEGVQLMIQMQCEALVDRFGASASICGLSGTIWLRYVATSGVFEEQWATDVIADSEKAFEDRVGKEEAEIFCKPIGGKHKTEPHTLYGQRAAFIWSKSLKMRIPVASSLAICLLACHIAREAILPTDILKWALEGKLPYMAAFLDIEKHIGAHSSTCPLTSRHLFRPVRAVGIHHLELLASSVAERIGLHLPSVNFYSIARRYLIQLSLPVEKILPHANRIFEWSMPPDLWFSTSPCSLPTRVCVMSILIVAIRVLYDINGLGKWETSLSSVSNSKQAVQVNQASEKSVHSREVGKKAGDAKANSSEMVMDTNRSSSSSHIQSSELDTAELLSNLEKAYHKLTNIHEYSKDLPSYLKYCKDVVFAGLTMSYEEENVAQQLWDIFEDREEIKPPLERETGCGILSRKRPRDEGDVATSTDSQRSRENGHVQSSKDCKISRHEHSTTSVGEKTVNEAGSTKSTLNGHLSMPTSKKGKAVKTDDRATRSLSGECSSSMERALRRMKSNMEENMFRYIPPRNTSPKKHGYIHFKRKRMSGELNYVAHADYYILLRACARLAQVDVRTMHIAVLKLERRLSWIERRIDSSLLELSCKLDDTKLSYSDDSLDFSSFKFKL